MRYCCLYHTNFGRNDGPPLFYWNVLKNQLKLDVTHLYPQGDISKYGKFDYWWWIDYGEDGLPTDKDWKIPKGGKKIYVCSDAHYSKEAFDYRVNKAKRFDYVFVNQKSYVDDFAKEGVKTTWLPHAVEPQAYHKFEIIKKYDVCFIGHLQEVKNYNGIDRVSFLDRMFKEFPNFYFGSRTPLDASINMFEDAAKKFSQSKIVLNISIKDDLNMRLFEATATGSLLLTNWLPTLGELFEDGKDLVTYKTLDEDMKKVKYYLEHEEERERIAESGMKKTLANHTYHDRVETILKLIK